MISYFLVTFEYSKIKGMVEIVAAITNQVANTDFSIIVLILHEKIVKAKKTLDHAIAHCKTCVTEPIHNGVKDNIKSFSKQIESYCMTVLDPLCNLYTYMELFPCGV